MDVYGEAPRRGGKEAPQRGRRDDSSLDGKGSRGVSFASWLGYRVT